ncbi:MAG: CdaR family protein, partial [Patescibacteria group bacterium]
MKIPPLAQLGLLIPVAILIWFAAFALSYHTFTLDVPIKIIGLKSSLAIVQDVTTLPVILRAKNISYYQLRTFQQPMAQLDVSFISDPGNYNIKPKVELNASDVWLVGYQPELITIDVVIAVRAMVALDIDITGFPANGYALDDVSVAPLQVQMIGADRLINTIQKAYVVIDVSKKQSSFIAKAYPEVRDSKGNKLANIQFSPNEVNVSVIINKGEMFKTVGLTPQFSGKLPAGYWVSSVQFDPPAVTLKSSVKRLENINSVTTTAINLSNRVNTFSDQVGLEIPIGVSVESNKLIKVTIQIDNSPFTRRLVLSPSYLDIAPGLKVVSTSPATVSLVLSGPSDKLDTIDPSKARLEIDIRSATSGDNTIKIDQSMFKLAEGIKVVSFEPT